MKYSVEERYQNKFGAGNLRVSSEDVIFFEPMGRTCVWWKSYSKNNQSKFDAEVTNYANDENFELSTGYNICCFFTIFRIL